MTSFSWILRAVLAVVMFGLTAAAKADTPLMSEAPKSENVEASLVSEVSVIAPGETFLVALRFKIRDGWHTYWRFAGDSGAPTTIAWTLPPGFAASDIIWPMPIEVPLGPLMDYGYEGEVLHLVSVTAPGTIAAGEAVELHASAEWLVCSDEICIPGFGDFALNLPVETQSRTDPEWSARLAEATAELPAGSPAPAMTNVTGVKFELSLEDPVIAKQVKSGEIENITYFPYQDGIIRHAVPQNLAVSDEGVAISTEASYLATSDRLPDPLSGLVVLTKSDGTRKGYEISAESGGSLAGLVQVQGNGSEDIGSGIGYFGAVLFALLGGLILNLMPCVFPVLSMKAVAFARRDVSDRKALRLSGWLFTAGVVATFVALAFALFALREGGAAIGWGYQLQSPVVVLLLAYLMFAVGLSLSGVLTIGTGVTGVGQSLAQKSGPAGAFFTGVLATIVAAPCTAPFMGAALGYAMLAPSITGLSIFVALGLGLALPYLIISHVPAALSWLPKPGPWMERFKEFLAFPMYGAAAWLIWVLTQQTGPQGLLAALIGLVLIAFGAWALKFTGGGKLLWAGRAVALAAGLSAIGLAAVARQSALTPPDEEIETSSLWQPYTAATLAEALAEGRPVFVDATAAWCLTCKVNELGALSSRRVLEAFEEEDALLLRADWTNRDAAVTELLTRHDRLGVPLYLYFRPENGGDAKILPQILTEDIVLAAIRAE